MVYSLQIMYDSLKKKKNKSQDSQIISQWKKICSRSEVLDSGFVSATNRLCDLEL